MQEKFILLDIDGVMVTSNSWKPVETDIDGFYKFNPEAVKELDCVLMKSDATVVLTSTHRIKYSEVQWKNILGKRLQNVRKIRILDSFLINGIQINNRLNEIMQWGLGVGLDKQYVILDDDKSLYDLPVIIKKHWVAIQPMIGLNKDAANEALKIIDILA